jgi:hypothetical protein
VGDNISLALDSHMPQGGGHSTTADVASPPTLAGPLRAHDAMDELLRSRESISFFLFRFRVFSTKRGRTPDLNFFFSSKRPTLIRGAPPHLSALAMAHQTMCHGYLLPAAR